MKFEKSEFLRYALVTTARLGIPKKEKPMDHGKAIEVLRQACQVSEGEFPSSPLGEDIRIILKGNHKTFRYLLLTALLAKSTDAKINAFSLQAGAELKGAYDARSLCHKVIVPLESELFKSAIGGSVEPFLNKPARFPTISRKNAVRKGADQECLNLLWGVAEQLENGPELATEALRFACAVLLEIGNRRELKFPEAAPTDKVISFLFHLLEDSSGGEIPVLLAGTAFNLLYSQMMGDYGVVVSPVNQSGASSRELGDIEIWSRGRVEIAVEVKDKPFTRVEVVHAVKKARMGGVTRVIFISGPQAGALADEEISLVEAEISELDVELSYWDLQHFLSFVAALPELDFKATQDYLASILDTSRMSDDTVSVVKEAIKKYLGS